MKLSELNDQDVKVISGPAPASQALRLSDIAPEEVQIVQEAPRGQQVYERLPAGPKQESTFSQAMEYASHPDSWKAIAGFGPRAMKEGKDYVGGAPPLAIPGVSGALASLKYAPELAKVMGPAQTAQSLVAPGALARAAQGLQGSLLGRLAAGAGQGFVMNAVGGQEGQSVGERMERGKSGAKLAAGIQVAAEALPVIGKVAKFGASKLGAALTGEADDVIRHYAERTDEVNALIKKSGGDVTEASDLVRTELSQGIQAQKAGINSKISQALNQAAPEKTIPVQPIIEKLQAAKARLNPNFKSDAIVQIDDMIEKIAKEADNGSVNLSSLYQIKQFLNEAGQSAFNKGGQIFVRAGEAARAAKDASGEARGLLKPASEIISKADSQLSKLHAIERRLNKNLITPGKPESALLAAASGANKRNLGMLQILERESGVPVVQRAKDLAAARAFANASLFPKDATGKAAARMFGAAGAGQLIAGPLGAGVAGALTSPATLKLAINTGNLVRQAVGGAPGIGQAVRNNPAAAQAIVAALNNQIQDANQKQVPVEITPEVEDYFRQNQQLLENIQDPKIRAEIRSRLGRGPAKSAIQRRMDQGRPQ